MFHAHLIALSARVQPTVPSAKVNILFKMVPVLEIQKELAKLLKSVELLSNVQLVALDAQMLLPAQGVSMVITLRGTHA